ncbi:MAG: thioredoxin domain-containing protein [Candidatus Acidiferrales bacterium]
MLRNQLLLFSIVLALSAPVFPQSKAKSQPLATVNGQAITSDDVSNALGEPLSRLKDQLYRMQQKKLQELIEARILEQEAARRGLTVDKLIEIEVTRKAEPVTAEEINTFYQGNKAVFSGGETAARQQVETLLKNQKAAIRRNNYLQSLKAQAAIQVYLLAPAPFRTKVSAEGAPARGPANAPVTIVEFEDFQCPYCKAVQPTLKQILSHYGDRVRLVYVDYPLESLHPAAFQAHQAARCAGEQDKFWEYHDLLFKNAPAANAEQLDAYAKQAGMDMAAFKACLSSGKYQSAIQKDEEQGNKLGVEGTPAFFINGRMITGARSFDEFSLIIDEELALKAP